MIYKFGEKIYDLDSRTFIMGIINVTPDSFSDGSLYMKDGKVDIEKIIYAADKMVNEGADFLDIGGESTRPGAEEITVEQEIERTIPVINAIKNITDIPISIDTYKHEVADEALKAGAVIVNDISGFNFDPKLPETTVKYNASCILMHIKGTPKSMQNNPSYSNVISEIKEYLKRAAEKAEKTGIKQIITDPGIGFGKTYEHNIEILKNIAEFKKLGYPVLIGLSRKSFINKIYESSPTERLAGTLVANAISVLNGANILRVHDVLENKRAVLTAQAIK